MKKGGETTQQKFGCCAQTPGRKRKLEEFTQRKKRQHFGTWDTAGDKFESKTPIGGGEERGTVG